MTRIIEASRCERREHTMIRRAGERLVAVWQRHCGRLSDNLSKVRTMKAVAVVSEGLTRRAAVWPPQGAADCRNGAFAPSVSLMISIIYVFCGFCWSRVKQAV
jgi:hypothetical protein